MAKIYVASSWKNPYQPDVVKKLREQGHQVFDFRNPPDGKGGFFWKTRCRDACRIIKYCNRLRYYSVDSLSAASPASLNLAFIVGLL